MLAQERLASSSQSRPSRPAAERSPPVMLLVALSAGAGIIHARAMIDHMSHYWLYGAFFAVLTYAQVLVAAGLYRRPDNLRWLMPAALGSLLVVGVWLISRSYGLPFGPWAGRAEPLGLSDLAATLDEVLFAGVVFARLRPDRWIAARLAWLNDGNCSRMSTMVIAFSLLATLVGGHTHPPVR